MVKKLLILVGAAAILFSLGCDGDADFVKMSQADWTAEGWTCWKRGDYDGAESAFGNALKVDPYYAEAHGGLAAKPAEPLVQTDRLGLDRLGLLVSIGQIVALDQHD